MKDVKELIDRAIRKMPESSNLICENAQDGHEALEDGSIRRVDITIPERNVKKVLSVTQSLALATLGDRFSHLSDAEVANAMRENPEGLSGVIDISFKHAVRGVNERPQ